MTTVVILLLLAVLAPRLVRFALVLLLLGALFAQLPVKDDAPVVAHQEREG